MFYTITNRAVRTAALLAVALGSVAGYLQAPESALADGRRDYYAQQASRRYFNLPQNARTFGMAGSSIAVSSDSSSVIGNPAGLGMMEGGDFSASFGRNTFSGNSHPDYDNIEQDEDSLRGLVALPIGPVIDGLPEYGNIGFGWNGYDSDSNDDLNTETDGNELYAAYSKALSDTLSLGYGLAFFNDELKGDGYSFESDSNFRHSFGVQHKATDTISWGGTFFYGHGDYDSRFAGQSASSSLRQYGFDLGLGYTLGNLLLTTSAGYAYYDADGDIIAGPSEFVVGGDEDGHSLNFALGAEYSANDWLALRAGYRYNGFNDYSFKRHELSVIDGSAKYNAWTAGLGLAIPVGNHYVERVLVDYGVEYRAIGDDDWAHVVTLSVPFNVCKPVV